MVELLTQPPPMDAIARMAAIEGVQITPTIVASQQGPDRRLGPEAAGAILVLQATFADEDRAAGFWQAAAGLMEKLATAPGFIRRYNFADGPHYTLIAFWRTPADAHSFFASDEHQAAMRDLFEHRWQCSHFAGLWECNAPRQRVIFCQDCDAVTPATEGTCGGCGTVLFDPYAATTSNAGGGARGVPRRDGPRRSAPKSHYTAATSPLVAATLTIPTLVVHGVDDTTAPVQNADNIYAALSSVANKMLLRVECGSHQAHQEGCSQARCDDGNAATLPYGGTGHTWLGPHSTISSAMIEWIEHGTLNGSSCGRFNVDVSGVLSDAGSADCPAV